MSRNHKSAQNAGTAFEQHVADYLAVGLDDDRIIRMPKHGSMDYGDIANLRFMGQRVCIECKNTKAKNYRKHLDEADIEAMNQDAPYYWVVQKVPGIGITNPQKLGLQLCYTRVMVLDAMRGDAPDDLFLHNTANFKPLPRTPFVSCTLHSLALILNHGVPLGPESASASQNDDLTIGED